MFNWKGHGVVTDNDIDMLVTKFPSLKYLSVKGESTLFLSHPCLEAKRDQLRNLEYFNFYGLSNDMSSLSFDTTQPVLSLVIESKMVDIFNLRNFFVPSRRTNCYQEEISSQLLEHYVNQDQSNTTTILMNRV